MLSPGFTFPRSSLTGLAEDLASRGYVAATVDHNYEAVAVTFPDGHITECLACELLPNYDRTYLASGRARDVSFVLDQLVAEDPVWRASG